MTMAVEIHRISVKDISPHDLFDKYISKRIPIILTDSDYATSLQSQLFPKLKQVTSKVLVESLDNGRFGAGKDRQEMHINELLKQLETRTDLYMTTQYNLTQELISPPMNAVKDMVKLDYNLFGNLIPQLVNLWMGATVKPTTSGLHHDYHDNFYFLVHGSKKFHLFPPKCAKQLYLNGQVRVIHSNGLVEYEGNPHVRGDGAPLDEVAQYRVERAEAILEDPDATGEEKAQAELELDDGLKDMLKYGNNGGFDDASDEDDFEEDDLAQEYEDDFEEDEDDEAQIGFDQAPHDSDFPSKRPRTDSSQHELNSPGDPPHFSRVDSYDKKKFPDLPVSEMRTLELKEGEILYLPASWFHEVISSGTQEKPLHMALNYWFYPPTEHDFARPYVDDFWKEKYLKQNEVDFEGEK